MAGLPAVEKKGGIDLNPQNLNIEVINEAEGANHQSFNPITFDPQNFQGFSFQIISVYPANDWEGAIALSYEKAEGAPA